jgi:predicted RNA polymerase sigma factor
VTTGRASNADTFPILATGPDTDPVRQDPTAEAIRLTRLIRALIPDDGEVAALLALMLLRADLLRRLGRGQQSREAYDKAIELAGNTAETAYLTRRRDQLR